MTSSESTFKALIKEATVAKAPEGIHLRTNEVKPGGPASRRVAAEIARLAGSQFPDAKQHIQGILDHAIKYTGPSKAGLKQAKDNLISVHEEFGPQVLAQTAKVLYEYFGSDAYFEETVHKVALCCKEGKTDLLRETAEFMARHGGHWWIKSLINAIESRGVNELERGMDLAPMAGPEPEPGVTPHYWQPERETAERRKNFAMITGELGFDKLRNLTSRLKAEGLSNKDICALTSDCGYSQNKEREIVRLFDVIALVKESGLDPTRLGGGFQWGQTSLISGVYRASKYQRTTRTEMKEILQLMVKNQIEWISEQDLRIALRDYIRPSRRGIVFEAFKEKYPGLLTWSQISDSLTIGIVGYVGAGAEATEQALEKLYMQDAHDRTQEIMANRYPKFGIFGPDKELVQALAQNPIFAPISLTLRKSETKTPLGLVDQAMHRFGKDSLRSVTRLAESGSEPEYALALMRTGNPEKLVEVLERVSDEARISAVRVINRHGLQVLQQAEGVVRSGDFNPQAFLQPVADALVHKSEKVIPIRPIALRHPLKPEHEQQLLFFYDQPPLWQRNIARAVRAYRSIYAVTYSRILYD